MSSGFGAVLPRRHRASSWCSAAGGRRWRSPSCRRRSRSAWWCAHVGRRSASRAVPGPPSQVPAFAVHGLAGGVRQPDRARRRSAASPLSATLAVLLWRRPRPAVARPDAHRAGPHGDRRCTSGSAIQRIGFGVEGGRISRYRYIGRDAARSGASRVAVDRLATSGARGAVGRPAGARSASIGVNAGALHTNGSQWAIRASDERSMFELIAGSPADGHGRSETCAAVPFSPDVSVASTCPMLVADGAIVPRARRRHPRKQTLVRKALAV